MSRRISVYSRRLVYTPLDCSPHMWSETKTKGNKVEIFFYYFTANAGNYSSQFKAVI